MTPGEYADRIRAACLRRPELRYSGAVPPDPQQGFEDNPMKGFCYIATQCFCFLTGAEAWQGFDGMHYWAVLDGEVWDLTGEQFDAEYLARIHADGRRTRFKHRLTKRAAELLAEANRV